MGLMCGVGVNDSGYRVKGLLYKGEHRDERVLCPFYIKWQSMMYRCYGGKRLEKHPSYYDCSVCEEWLTFSNFKKWMENQDWRGKELDKDILIKGNRVYSPESCVFVSERTNMFTIDRKSDRGKFMIGVYFEKSSKKFKSQISNPFTMKRENLGRFINEVDAHLAWRKRKHELACQLADLQTDERVANALRTRYL